MVWRVVLKCLLCIPPGAVLGFYVGVVVGAAIDHFFNAPSSAPDNMSMPFYTIYGAVIGMFAGVVSGAIWVFIWECRIQEPCVKTHG